MSKQNAVVLARTARNEAESIAKGTKRTIMQILTNWNECVKQSGFMGVYDLGMVWNDVMDVGIFIEQNKTGIKQIKEWSPRLHSAIQIARNTFGDNGKYVITNSNGEKVTSRTLNKWWDKAKKIAEEKDGMPFGCTFHDIKAKSISDYSGSTRDKQIFSGHKTESQVLVYDRKVKITPSLNAPYIEKQA